MSYLLCALTIAVLALLIAGTVGANTWILFADIESAIESVTR